MLTGVLANDIGLYWPEVAPLLQKAIDKSQNDYSIHDIRSLLEARDMQLWIWLVDSKVAACLVTVIANYPHRRVCQMPFIAGRFMKDWLKMETVIAQWAKERGCSQLEGFCRPGWTRVLKNWSIVWTTMRRDI